MLELILGVFAAMIAAALSRKSEYRADEGGAKLAGNQAMASALSTLKASQEGAMPQQVAAFGIRSGKGMWTLLASHPPR